MHFLAMQQAEKGKQSEMVGQSRITHKGTGGLSSTCESSMQRFLIGTQKELGELKKMVEAFINRLDSGLGLGFGQDQSSMSQA